ncbi:MAG TPA: methylated-DNA--[protein]-cysteine S-methyltransferase [Bacilli bacterium]|nr:methylated-DNA--[protein]-cysteine S-methyltransferase [Bacilli bacterium]
MSRKSIYYTTIYVNLYQLTLYKTDQGLVLITTKTDQPENFAEEWLTKTFKDYQLIHDDQFFNHERDQFTAYFNGQLTRFDFTLDLHGTLFQKSIWQQLQQIPYGETWSYSELADSINRPEAVRAVSRAIGQNPLLIVVPCHRVIGKNKQLTGFRSGLALKKSLLQLESN